LIRFDAEFERSQLRMLAQLLRSDLIGGDARLNVDLRFLRMNPVRKVAPARAWSPAPSPSARPCTCASPLKTSSRSRNGSNGFIVDANSKLAPSVAGVHLFIMIRWARRRNRDAQPVSRLAVKAGVIASNNGKASVTPIPRRNVRRGKDFFVTIIVSASSSFGKLCF
jgi:hypothetical protein